MVSEIEVGICNFKWTKSVPMQKNTFPVFTKKQLIIDMQWYAFQTRGEVSERERLSPVYTSRPRLAMFPGCPFLYWTYWVVQIRDPLNNHGLEIMDYFSTFGTRLGVPTMLLLQVDLKWRRLKFWMEVVFFFSRLGLKPLKQTWVNMMYLQVY